MANDFSRLTDCDHWVGWLGEDPGRAVLATVEETLEAQVEGSKVEWMKVTEEPFFLTGGRRDEADENKVIVVRAAMALAFELEVRAGEEKGQELRGILSWVAAGLDAERRDRVWLDLDTQLAVASELLKERIYELDDAP